MMIFEQYLKIAKLQHSQSKKRRRRLLSMKDFEIASDGKSPRNEDSWQQSLRSPKKLQRYMTRNVTSDTLLYKIERLWGNLDEHKHSECQKYEDQIRANKRRLRVINKENTFLMGINRIQQRKITKRESSKTKKQLVEQIQKEKGQIDEVKEKLRF